MEFPQPPKLERETFTVLGASGFIGSHLAAQLRQQGHTCNTPRRDEKLNLSRPLGHVVYTIGLTADFRARPLDAVEAHVCVLRELLAAAKFDSLTYLSSTRFYRYARSTKETASFDMNPMRPDSIYDLSKLLGESMCVHAGRKNIKIARLSNVIGLRNDRDIFIDQILDEILNSGKVSLYDSLDSEKDYISIKDVVEILINLAILPANGCFNIASGKNISNRIILQYIKNEFDFEILGSGDDVLTNSQPIDISLIVDKFNFTPIPFEKFFPDYLKEYRNTRGIK